MQTLLLMVLAIIVGSAISLLGGALLFMAKNHRTRAIRIALPFGAGALLAAAFFDLLPEAFELADPSGLLAWALVGFMLFFLLERLSGWFHHHHEHDDGHRHEQQSRMVMVGDLLHNVIDGIAIATAFLVSPALGFVTTLAVSAHEIPKELGTFGILLSRGWRDRKVLIANVLTAVGTLVAAIFVYTLGESVKLPEAELLAVTAGIFIYIAASDIIPEIHEQSRSVGTWQAVILLIGIAFVALIINLLGV